MPSDEARVGVIHMAVYWNAAPACRLVPVTPTSGVKAGNMIGVHARDSIVGTSNPEHAIIRYYAFGPTGFAPRTFESPVPGLPGTVSQNGDGRGWCYLIRATLPGDYYIRARMLVKDNGVWKNVLSNSVIFNVEAENRTEFYLDPWAEATPTAAESRPRRGRRLARFTRC